MGQEVNKRRYLLLKNARREELPSDGNSTASSMSSKRLKVHPLNLLHRGVRTNTEYRPEIIDGDKEE